MKHQTNERILQNKISIYLSNPALVLKTDTNNRLQILSPGKINKFAGPDFSGMALLLNGKIIVGNTEFHRKSSDWFKHKHNLNKDYDDIVLHIVFEKDIDKPEVETLILDENTINNIDLPENNECSDLNAIEDLQHFALLRLLRKSADAQRLLNNKDLIYSIKELIRSFLERYLSRRHRPVYEQNNLFDIIDKIDNSFIMLFLQSIIDGETEFIPDRLLTMLKTKILNEGASLRREIILNCVLPLAVCLANEQARINLFFWYWSIEGLTEYGILNTKFPNLPQKFLWQQQGMLEYIRLHGMKDNVETEVVKKYGFAKVLNFYQFGKTENN